MRLKSWAIGWASPGCRPRARNWAVTAVLGHTMDRYGVARSAVRRHPLRCCAGGVVLDQVEEILTDRFPLRPGPFIPFRDDRKRQHPGSRAGWPSDGRR
jgi:hypothetical protein